MIISVPYNRELAVQYARKWALSRNPLFADFTGSGGNCTNFVSQALLAGIGIMDFTPTFGWYYRSITDRAPAWSGVDELYGFLTDSGGFASSNSAQGPFGETVLAREQIMPADIVQLQNSRGDYYHTLIISDITPDEIFVCAQSNDALDRPLSSYSFANMRIIHILGGTLLLPTEAVFAPLSNGTVLKSIVTRAEAVSV